jgi:flagellar basal body-associated protein FliL
MNNIFPKIDKKILIALIVILAVILIAGFFVYQYFNNIDFNVENSIGGTNTENVSQQLNKNTKDNTPQVQVTADGIRAEGASGEGTIIVCSDKCGDGICQITEPECNDLNCACFESVQECPQDCK